MHMPLCRRARATSRGASRCTRRCAETDIVNLLPGNQRQRRTCYALYHILYPVWAAHMSIFWMDLNSTSYRRCAESNVARLSGRGSARAETAQGTPTQSDVSPKVL